MAPYSGLGSLTTERNGPDRRNCLHMSKTTNTVSDYGQYNDGLPRRCHCYQLKRCPPPIREGLEQHEHDAGHELQAAEHPELLRAIVDQYANGHRSYRLREIDMTAQTNTNNRQHVCTHDFKSKHIFWPERYPIPQSSAVALVANKRASS